MDSLFSQVEIVPGTSVMLRSLLRQAEDLYSKGTRWLLFLTHTPIDRATVFTERGPEAAAKMGTDITEYNAQLAYATGSIWSIHITQNCILRNRKFPTRAAAQARAGPLHSEARRNTSVSPPHIQVQQGEPFFEEIQAYNKHFLSLLELEQNEDEAVLRERLSTWSLFRLQEEGYTITGLSAFWMGAPKFGRSVASFSLGPGIDLPEHRFENGTQVLVSRFDPLQEPPLHPEFHGLSCGYCGASFSNCSSTISLCSTRFFLPYLI
ncbi:hypothetical protein C8R48DRAFT_833478 [Suillus tomentosus]|nr:hypothetical protein C8R48DRAFT_833478 [Suillus tomentosus]